MCVQFQRHFSISQCIMHYSLFVRSICIEAGDGVIIMHKRVLIKAQSYNVPFAPFHNHALSIIWLVLRVGHNWSLQSLAENNVPLLTLGKKLLFQVVQKSKLLIRGAKRPSALRRSLRHFPLLQIQGCSAEPEN